MTENNKTSKKKADDKLNQKKIEKQRRLQKQREQQNKEAKRLILIPLIKTFALWLVLVGIIHFFVGFFGPFLISFTAKALKVFCTVFFIPITLSGLKNVTIMGYPIQVVVECTAYNYYLFAIALAAFAKWTFRDKLINVAIFLFAIFIINNLRFIILAAAGKFYPDIFDIIHDYFWNILFAFITLGLWMLLNGKSQKRYLEKYPQALPTESNTK